MNFLVPVLAGLVPLLVGFAWYNPKVMGRAWIKSTGLTEEQLKNANMGKVFALTLLFSLMLAFMLTGIVIHQNALPSLVMNEPGFSEKQGAAYKWYTDSMAVYGKNFRTFGHGALHGTIAAIFIALPILGINALFERKSGKYIFIHLGYWIITLALMGGIICQWA